MLLPINSLKYESKCSALGRHRGSSDIILGAMDRQWLVKREQVARKWTLVSLSAWRTDFRFFLAQEMIVLHITCNAVRFRPVSPILPSFEAECKALDNHCCSTVSLTDVSKSHCCQKERQQFKIELLTSCPCSYWSHFLFFQHEQIQV